MNPVLTTLQSRLLDAHPLISCPPETCLTTACARCGTWVERNAALDALAECHAQDCVDYRFEDLLTAPPTVLRAACRQ